MYVFYEDMVQSVVGHKSWRKSRSKLLISEAMSTSQEATALWILKNYEHKWNNNSVNVAKFTGSTRGNRMFQGWSMDGIQEYNAITKHVIIDRKRGHAFEESFKDHQLSKFIQAKNNNKSHGINTNINEELCTTVECYNDLIVESDVDEHSLHMQSSSSHEVQSLTDHASAPFSELLFSNIDNQIAL